METTLPLPEANFANCPVICVNNMGMSDSFENGIEYLCTEDNGRLNSMKVACITVINMSGYEVIIPKDRFVLKKD